MKKWILMLLVLICCFSVSSCKKDDFTYSQLDKITYENLLSLPGKYIVVAYQSNCDNCEKLLPSVADYYRFTEKNDDAMPIYAININLKINQKMLLLSDEEYPTNMMNTTSYKNVKIKATPAIMVITNKKLTKVISDYNTQKPVTDGKAYFEGLMK